MWLIIKDNKKTQIRYFKYKGIRYLINILVNKIKGKEVKVLNDE